MGKLVWFIKTIFPSQFDTGKNDSDEISVHRKLAEQLWASKYEQKSGIDFLEKSIFLKTVVSIVFTMSENLQNHVLIWWIKGDSL